MATNLVPVKVTGNIGTIEDNLDQVELSIREKVAEYSAVVVTEDTIKDGKKFLADIRKEKKTLDDERKAIKNKWMEPYNAFEKRAKEIIALYDEPVNIINGQLAEYEENRKKLKRQAIQEAYDFVKGDLADWLPLKKIYNPKWENATYSDKKVREDMELVFDQMKVSISTIKTMNSEFEEDALRVLRETGSLQASVAEINKLQAQKERFMEQARREAELARQRAEQDAQAKEEKPEETERKEPEPRQEQDPANIAENAPAQETADMPDPAPFAFERMLTVTVKIGENDFGALKEFLDSVGAEYEVM